MLINVYLREQMRLARSDTSQLRKESVLNNILIVNTIFQYSTQGHIKREENLI